MVYIWPPDCAQAAYAARHRTPEGLSQQDQGIVCCQALRGLSADLINKLDGVLQQWTGLLNGRGGCLGRIKHLAETI